MAGAVRCWAVRDTGLAPAPGPFRRLGGAVRHLRGDGALPWPDEMELVVADGRLVVPGVGAWPLEVASVELVRTGPPVTFVLRVPGASRLLAAPAGPDTDTLLAALTPTRS